MDSTSQAYTHQDSSTYGYHSVPNLPPTETNYDTLGRPPSDPRQVDYLRLLPSWKGCVFSLLKKKLILVINLPFLHVMLLTRLSSIHLQTSLSTIMASHILLLLMKELISQPLKRGSGLMLMEFRGLTNSYHPDTDGLKEEWKGLLRGHLQCQQVEITQTAGQVFQKAVYALNLCIINGTVSTITRIYSSKLSKNSTNKNGAMPNYLQGPASKMFFLVHTNLFSADLQDLVPNGKLRLQGYNKYSIG